AGPVVLNFPPAVVGRTGDFAMTFRLGERDFVARPAQGINTLDDMLQAIINGNSYVNIHTTQNPGGEIRSQLRSWSLYAPCALRWPPVAHTWLFLLVALLLAGNAVS